MSELKTQAWSSVNEALQLDSNGDKPAAYKKYLEGIRKLCIYLEEDSDLLELSIDSVSRQKCSQVISVMRKSIERLEQLVNDKPNVNQLEEGSARPKSLPSTDSLGFENLNLNIEEVMSGEQALSKSDPSSSSSVDNSNRSRLEVSPIEKARRENGLIYRAYQARCQLVKDSKKRASLYLELHRKLTENIIVARAKEAALRQVQIQREKDILELAAKKLDLKGGIPHQVTNNTEDWEKLLLYAQILQYEEKEVWPNNLRQKLQNPAAQNEAAISEVIKSTLNNNNHPLSLWVCKCQNQLLERIHFFLKDNEDFLEKYPLSDITIGENLSATSNRSKIEQLETDLKNERKSSKSNEQSDHQTLSVSLSKMPLNKMWVEQDVLSLFDPLAGQKLATKTPYSSFIDPEQERMSALRTRLNDIIKDTCKAIEMLVQMMCATYELTDDCAQDVCYQMCENYLFRGIWPQLLHVFRIINYHSEKSMSLVMERLSKCPPEEVGIPTYFDLESCKDEAISGLRRIATLNTPLAKLHQLVHVAQIVCARKTHHASGKPFGADDLIGIMCYLLVQTRMPHLVSEFEALEQLVPHRYLMGEEGYALTTHLTAMKYLESQLEVSIMASSNPSAQN